MFKNALAFRLQLPQPIDLGALEERLGAARFAECSPAQSESFGWVAPRGEGHATLAESVGGELVLELMVETKAVPAPVVKQRLAQALDQAERESGRRPRGRHAREIKEQLVHELLPRAFPKRSSTRVWIDPEAQRAVLGTTTPRRADKLLSLLAEALGPGASLLPLQTKVSAATAMSRWLTEREAPSGFTLDRDCVLEQPDNHKAVVRYTRHDLDIEEVGQHISQGKLPTQLALTWNDRVSVLLTASMAIKRIKLLDLALEGAKAQDEGFDADVALTTGEMRGLLGDLVQALDGELEPAG